MIVRGPRIVADGLGAGMQRITLRARDRTGRAATASIKIRVTPRRPLFISLKAPFAISRKAKHVTLTVSTTFRTRLTVGRTKAFVGRRATKVRVKLKPGRSLLQLTLTLGSGKLASRRLLLVSRK